MQKTYTNPVYEYRHHPDQDAPQVVHHPVIIAGAGPCGLAAALDLALQGIPSVVLDDNNTVSVGSRAICFAKRTLEIMDRYGCAERMVDKGVTWQHGKVFFRDEMIYEFNLLPESDHAMPAFINLQQYYFEEYLVDRTADFPEIDLRWKSRITAIEDRGNGAANIAIDTPDGSYHLTCDYLVVADGANSGIRGMLGLESRGQVFQDRFLIADVVMQAEFPTERWFWFDPPFHPNQSALLHRQADNVWRIDLQLGWDADPEEEVKEENIRPRLEAMLGPHADFDLEWASIYTFQCRKMDHFIHGRCIFTGDAAHQVSPFGARGANGGVQSVENLAWKLARVLRGEAGPDLLESYNTERQHGALENILNSTRATDFITPKSTVSRIFRDETLRLAADFPFARRLVNSGRLSVPCHYPESPLNTPDSDTFASDLCAGSPPRDAPVHTDEGGDWLLRRLGNRFVLMVNTDVENHQTLQAELEMLRDTQDLDLLLVGRESNKALTGTGGTLVQDYKALVAERYDLQPGTTYLFRPDQIVAARWRKCDASEVQRAMRRALGINTETAQ